MTDVTTRPSDSQNVEITAGEQATIVSAADAVDYLDYFKAEGYSVRVELSSGGYHITAEVENKALELAGLSGLQAAKQTSKGFVEF